MPPDSPNSDAPRELPASAGGPALSLRGDLVAVHGLSPGEAPPGARLLLDRGRIAVVPSSALPPAPAATGPVYSSADGEIVVPTGRVFVRFAAGTDAHSRAADLERAGFSIEKVPVSAPHAAWVTARRDGVVAALRGLADLARLLGVDGVEPQWLRERVNR